MVYGIQITLNNNNNYYYKDISLLYSLYSLT